MVELQLQDLMNLQELLIKEDMKMNQNLLRTIKLKTIILSIIQCMNSKTMKSITLMAIDIGFMEELTTTTLKPTLVKFILGKWERKLTIWSIYYSHSLFFTGSQSNIELLIDKEISKWILLGSFHNILCEVYTKQKFI